MSLKLCEKAFERNIDKNNFQEFLNNFNIIKKDKL